MPLKTIFFIMFCIFCFQKPVPAAGEPALESLQKEIHSLTQTVAQLQSTVRSQNELLQKQSVRIAALESGKALPGEAVPPARVPTLAGISQGFNPEIGVVGTVQTKLTENTNDAEGNDTIALKELEFDFAQVVDPYSRLDAILSFNDAIENQNAAVEEAYYTRWGLPFGFTGQIGKFRAKIGKQNLLHLHQLETAGYPLVIKDFFGEEGLASSGARLQNLIPNPWDIPVEIMGEVLRGNNGPSFSGKSRRPIFNTHVKSYFDLTKDLNLELGWTTLFGDENPRANLKGSDRYGVKVFGGDATFHWFLPEGKKIKWQNEIYFQNRTNRVHVNDNPWGFYTLLDFRFSPRFSTGVRFDYLEPLDVVSEHRQSTEISPYFVFWQSEFADFKFQYSHIEPASGASKSDHRIVLQADFLIGSHKHPVQ